jgi:hypothetical protein
MSHLKLTSLTIVAGAAVLVTACASNQHEICDASAAGHRELAAEEAQKAEAHTWRGPVQTSPNREHQERAERHRDRAERHDQLAEQREASGDSPCAR